MCLLYCNNEVEKLTIYFMKATYINSHFCIEKTYMNKILLPETHQQVVGLKNVILHLTQQ